MRLPVWLTIEGHKVRVRRARITRRLHEGYSISGQLVSTGDRQTLTVAPGQTRANERDTVLHEVLHACLDLAQARDPKVFPMKTEEYVVSHLTGWLLAALRENPALVEYLTEAD